MAGCPEIRIDGVTPEVWSCLWRRAREMGLPVQQAPGGTLDHPDGAADWRWDEASGVLAITVTRTRRVDCAWVEQRLRETARACGAS